MNLWKTIFNLTGWSIDMSVDPPVKCVICVAPHTSNWDFLLGLFAYRSMGRKANFLMKKFWFFFPLKYILRGLGGIPVGRGGGRKGSLTAEVIEKFRNSDYLNLAVTPEGTRSKTNKWRTGFLTIARGAGVPVILASINFAEKRIEFLSEFKPGALIEEDLERVKEFYAPMAHKARYPEKFEA